MNNGRFEITEKVAIDLTEKFLNNFLRSEKWIR